MANLLNTDHTTNFKYGLYINFKALYDYHLELKINDSYLTMNHCIIIAFIIEQFEKNHKMPDIKYNGERYALMNSPFILPNLIYLKLKNRQLSNYLESLKKHKLIKTYIIKNKDRYINVNDHLLKLWYSQHHTIRHTNYLEANWPDMWKSYVNEWKPYFNERKIDFKNFIDNFNDTCVINGENLNSKNIYEHLINATNYKLFGGKTKY